MLATEYASRDRNVTLGWASVMMTFPSDGAETLRIPSRRDPAASGSLAPKALARSRENLTAAALSGVPSENFTPARRMTVYVSPSGDTSGIDAASSGEGSVAPGA